VLREIMVITKKLRFEVFKRDGFKCAYCGKSPPQVMLEVDHIQPKSKKGKDDINNLITACFDCNRGKKNIPLTRIPLKLSQNLEVLKESEDQLKEYRKFVQRIERRMIKDIEDISQIYANYYEKWELSERFKTVSLKRFLSILPKHEIAEAMNLAISKFPSDEDKVIQYFCGICWRKIKGESPKY
jgi:CRISPR/Cas system Type II protein with McrA/HNH and RuvC-like nuclease domain